MLALQQAELVAQQPTAVTSDEAEPQASTTQKSSSQASVAQARANLELVDLGMISTIPSVLSRCG
jgi:hypothetical protein